MASTSRGQTCLTCRVQFESLELQQGHFRSEWHRYNVQRKAASVPCVSLEVFLERRTRKLEEARDQKALEGVVLHCEPCRKSYNSQNAYDSHCRSKKHVAKVKAAEARQAAAEAGEAPESVAVTDATPKEPFKAPVALRAATADDWGVADLAELKAAFVDRYASAFEGLTAEELTVLQELVAEAPVMPPNTCMFCSHELGDFDGMVEHITMVHSFHVPDIEYCVDLQGFLAHLQFKVCALHLCLKCDGSGKSFHSLEAVQKHMLDMAHCKVTFNGDEVEFEDFFDYSSTWEERGLVPGESTGSAFIDDETLDLVLPSGKSLGHKSFQKFYKQRLAPEESREAVLINRLANQYRLLGWHGSADEDELAKRKEGNRHRRSREHFRTRVGIRANNQKHFRPQVDF